MKAVAGIWPPPHPAIKRRSPEMSPMIIKTVPRDRIAPPFQSCSAVTARGSKQVSLRERARQNSLRSRSSSRRCIVHMAVNRLDDSFGLSAMSPRHLGQSLIAQQSRHDCRQALQNTGDLLRFSPRRTPCRRFLRENAAAHARTRAGTHRAYHGSAYPGCIGLQRSQKPGARSYSAAQTSSLRPD